ncbi:MAG TPA: phosphoribosylformylglycinamidine synthase subunit PurL, partial [Gemmatimonadales bacterium]|nr:phosphoribosylformylglycinamidine synthase subunit PurL [Gemmatimonadales bacterium]
MTRGALPPTPFPGDPPITPQLVREHNLTDEEYGRITALLGRTPSFAELGVFSALWSEHCSYKHSRPVLRTFPTTGAQVVQGPGENAGVLRLPDGWAVAFKIESHNHPSAVEPYQGAATGVGGILRDVFTMGARPVAVLNSLRFGPLDAARNRYLFAGVVKGVGDYGNCVGVPTLGGEVDFGPSYGGNPLVNAMCVGLLKETDLITAAAHGVGNVLLVVGSRTGRDGIHGASFASEELTQQSQQRRPQVQVGDPFTEKLLLEASLELIASGHIVAIQDMGAAGLTSSSAEMAAKGGVGVEIDLALVPTREPGMTPYEILLSESQERMLVVAKADRVAAIQAIAAKWDLDATPIGRVTDDGMYRAKWKDQVVVEIPGRRLIDDCPLYTPEAREDEAIVRLRAATPPASRLPPPDEVLLKLLDHPPIASKRWVYEQYDSTVQAGTVIGPGGDAGVIRVRDAAFGIAVTVDCNSRYVLLDPYEGGKAAVAEAARNIACTGAQPLGVTDCLNFGSPERPAAFYQFTESCRGIAEACRALDTPVTGGNVSFYNENPKGAVDPTPVVGMVGLLPQVDRAVPSHGQAVGDVVFVLGETRAELGGSQLWEAVHGFVGGAPPRVDLAVERRLVDYLVAAAARGLVCSAHDCSQGGLGVALAEVAMGGPYDETGFGLDIDLTTYGLRLTPIDLLFSESHGRAVVTCRPEGVTAV